VSSEGRRGNPAAFVFVGIVGLAISITAPCQQPSTELPSFEAVAIRPSSHPHTPEGYSFSDVNLASAGRFRAVNANLHECIQWAYEVKDYQLDEPDWLKSNDVTFDIEATAPAEASKAEARLMLRRLLTERFGLVLHREMKTMPAFALTVGNGKPRLENSAATSPAGMRSDGSQSTIHMTSAATTLAAFATALSRNLDRPVLDRTDLTGLYAMDIEYARQGSLDSDAASIAGALQKLGLRLESVRAPIEVIKVDHAVATPTPN
jgi:uncharacterized protein (TIGR03435 family)